MMSDARVGKWHTLARHCSLGKEREAKSSKKAQTSKKERKQCKGCKRGGNESRVHEAEGEEARGRTGPTCAGKQC